MTMNNTPNPPNATTGHHNCPVCGILLVRDLNVDDDDDEDL